MKTKIEKLEMVRGLASCYILVGHTSAVFANTHAPSQHSAVPLALRFGQEAVICFFLLSGFVIHYSHHLHRDHSFTAYLKRRVLRIYPIFLLALAIAYSIAALSGYPAVNWRLLAGNIFMLQDLSTCKPGVWFDTFYNPPLWSLSYEWWFYMMFFPFYSRIPVRWQLPLVAMLSLAGLFTYAWRPNQISLFLLYFIIWWTGLELSRTYCRGTTPTFYTQRYSALILAGFVMIIPIAVLYLMPRSEHISFGLHPILEIRHFAAALVLLCLGLAWSHFHWRGFSAVFGAFSVFAPISYAVYVLHFPLVVSTMSAGWLPNPAAHVAVFVSLTIGLAYLVERTMRRLI